MNRRWCTGALWALIICGGAIAPVMADANAFLKREEVREYITELSEETGLDHHRLSDLIAGATKRPDIIEAISKPAERTLTWQEYRPIFLTEKRIREGRLFLQEHHAILSKAEEQYGVPPEIVTAIIGVETFYGRITGNHRVLDALVTLAFDYPPRGSFFRRELSAFLVLSEAEGWQTAEVKGSYAGAMGVSQFIASSYQHYAVDFDGDGTRNLFDSLPDIIGSVASYLSVHGWRRGEAVTEPWALEHSSLPQAAALNSKALKPAVPLATVKSKGFTPLYAPDVESGSESLVTVMTLLSDTGEEVWIGYPNFYVITRYNHSHLYAMAVSQLAEAIGQSSDN